MNFSLCPYKFIFGKPNEGVHKYRIFNIAIVDTSLTILAAYLIHKAYNQDFYLVLLCLFISGIILHNLFCVRTTIDKLIFM